jgi:hypothetical protein
MIQNGTNVAGMFTERSDDAVVCANKNIVAFNVGETDLTDVLFVPWEMKLN